MTIDEQLSCLDKLESLILKKAQQLHQDQLYRGHKQHSDKIYNLIALLGKAQAEYPVIISHDYDTVITIIRPILYKYGLSVVQQQRLHYGSNRVLHTILVYTGTDCEWLESICPITEDKDVRLSELQMLLGIALQKESIKILEPKLSEKIIPSVIIYITDEQRELLEHELGNNIDLTQEILKQWGLRCLADMPKHKFMTALTRIRDIKEKQSTIK